MAKELAVPTRRGVEIPALSAIFDDNRPETKPPRGL